MSLSPVLSTDTPNSGRVKWNDNDEFLDGRIDEAESALNTHKSGTDHDGRYYTKAQVDTELLDLQGDISGVSDALTTHKSSGDHDSRYYTKTQVDALIRPETGSFFGCFEAITEGSWGKIAGIATSSGLGLSLGKAGSLIRVQVCNASGAITYASYSPNVKTFGAGDRFALFIIDEKVHVLKNGSSMMGSEAPVASGGPLLVTVYYYLDN